MSHISIIYAYFVYSLGIYLFKSFDSEHVLPASILALYNRFILYKFHTITRSGCELYFTYKSIMYI